MVWQREQGYGTTLREEHALLSRDEVLSVRLYTGPGYQPINNFLRQISGLTGAFRQEVIQHTGVTLAATVAALISAVRKLSAVSTEEESTSPLWRGVRGNLPKGFWVPDETGMVCAVDMAFMSTSRHKQTPIDYMGGGDNVLWSLHPSCAAQARAPFCPPLGPRVLTVPHVYVWCGARLTGARRTRATTAAQTWRCSRSLQRRRRCSSRR